MPPGGDQVTRIVRCAMMSHILLAYISRAGLLQTASYAGVFVFLAGFLRMRRCL
jgi:hypothetical protein